MTFVRAKADGFPEGHVITAAQLEDIDENLPDAIDGASGGTYANSAAIVLQGEVVLNDHNAVFAQRVDTSTAGNASADLTVASDIYLSTVPINSAPVWTLRHTGTVAQAGDCIRVSRQPQGGADTTGGVIVREDVTTLISWALGDEFWALFVFDGTDWRTAKWGGDVTPTTI